MSVIARLRQARNPEEVAVEIEPLAQALATLADETQESLKAQQDESRRQAANWTRAQEETAEAWRDSASTLRSSAQALIQAAETAQRAARGWRWKLWTGVALASGMPMLVLLIGLWVWGDPYLMEQKGITYLIMRITP